MIHIGFTGTQFGMTRAQGETVWKIVSHLPEFIAHHGDCIGADDTFDKLVRLCPNLRGIVVHPPDNTAKRAFVSTLGCEVRPEKPYLERNLDIVREVVALIATPKESNPQMRSGTWATVRRAQEWTVPIAIVTPGGGVGWDVRGQPWPIWPPWK